jgi:PIN domain nuclease of toxin-antitoxin system
MLLDTHIWIWYAEGNTQKLRPASIKKLDAARKAEGLVVSAISVWELGMQCHKGRIQLSYPFRKWVDAALSAPGIRVVPLDADTAAESTMLPGVVHGDPADRFLIATARSHGYTLATRDKGIIAYASLGHVHALKL